MDVKCERCNTEYEFDDALVSGRGTTVKCTNCGHKFKIRRSDGDFSEDFWNVTTGDGRTLVFTSLRELQRAIQTHLVERNDRLSRGGLPPKAIGQIPELASFFDQRDARKSLPPGELRAATRATQDGLGPTSAQMRSSRPPPPPGAAAPNLAPPRARLATRPDFPPPPAVLEPRGGKTTLIGTGSPLAEDAVPAAPAMRARMASVPPPPTEREPEPDTTRFPPEPPAASTAPESAIESVHEAPPPVPVAFNKTAPILSDPAAVAKPAGDPIASPPPLPPSARHKAAPHVSPPPPLPERRREPPSLPADVSSPLPPPATPVLRSLIGDVDEASDRMRGPSASMPDVPVSGGRRRSVGGFIVAAIVAGCVLMLGAVWAQKNLGTTLGNKPPPAAATTDPKAASLLAEGEKALADGNLDQAKSSFDKASVLAERDPRLLLGVARLAATRADIEWLRSRLLPTDAADEHRLTRDSLNELSAAARKAADDALAVAPEDPASLRAKIDALRISGDRDGARALVSKISPSSAQPESAYVLAALDLAEVEPLWSTVIERLRVAASAETGPGRARAALVYALARSGEVEGAKAEVERLRTMQRAHPLLPLLRAFAERAKPVAKVDAGEADASAVAAVDVRDGGDKRTGDRPGGDKPGGDKPGAVPGDPRELVRQGEKARVKGDYERARMLYSAALDKNPNDSEALSGLAAISYAQRDLTGARASYKRVLAINPNYMPALVGVADVDWESGDRASALKVYKEIVDRYPEGTYPARVKERLESGGGG